MLHALNASTTRIDVANDRAHVLFRNRDFNRHHRLKQYRTRLLRGFLECHRTGNLEGHFVRVDIVVAAVEECRLEVDHLVTGQHAIVQRLADALLGRLDVFLRNHAAFDGIDKFKTCTRLVRFQANLDVPVVTRTTRLADVLTFRFRRLADRLAERNLRLAYVRLNLVLTLHAVDKDLEVQLAHTTDDRLTRIMVRTDLEGWILIRESRQRHAHLLLVGLGLRLNRNRDDRLGKGNGTQRNRMLRGAQRVTCLDVLQAHARADVTGINLGDVFALVGVHLHQSAHALGLTGTRVQYRVTRLQRTR